MDTKSKFIAPRSFKATYRAIGGDTRIILCELRMSVDEKLTFFTVLDDQSVQTGSISEFVKIQPDCASLSINHDVYVWRSGLKEDAILVEEYSRTTDEKYPVDIRLSLKVGQDVFTSQRDDTISDCIIGLSDVFGHENLGDTDLSRVHI